LNWRRILQVLDVIEPRAKMGQSGEDFPGAVGKQITAGEGRTCVLRGAAVVLSDYRETSEVTTSRDPNGEIIDMSGPGAEIGTYGKTNNVVVMPRPKDGLNPLDYLVALKIAGLKTAAYLARAGEGLKPDEIEVYDLPPLAEMAGGWEDLPRVVYIFQILTLQFEPIPGEPVFYGRNAGGIVPTIIHPNEVLDGAITSALPALNVQTYHIQNHPIIRELYRRHGKDLCFTGVIITTAPNNVTDYERVANIAANLAKYVSRQSG